MFEHKWPPISSAPGPDAELSLAGLNEFGDIVCPHCGLNIITAAGCRLVPGWASCTRCRRWFSVSADLACEAEITTRLLKPERILHAAANAN